jgi:beta-1,4-mannosyl-glycoprotein beta-1,4-N-acetylglucosaminyltransferase
LKVYDAFLFFNELDLLEIRLHELDSAVDMFVLVESTKTFSSKCKPLYYLENKERFARFADKIRHVVVDDTPDISPDPAKGHSRHKVEQYQRACLDRGLVGCCADDMVIVSDVDEIFRPVDVQRAKELLTRQRFVLFEQKFFYYYLNGLCVQNGVPAPWNGPVASLARNYIGGQKMRDDRGTRERERLRNAGWHFSYLGGIERIVEKIESYAHAEFDNGTIKDKESLASKIGRGVDIFNRPNRPNQKYIAIDESFPKHVRDNMERFSHLVKEV